jgi:hypothetical protein
MNGICFNNTCSRNPIGNFRLLLFKYTLILFVLSVSAELCFYKIDFGIYKIILIKFWRKPNRWFIFIKVLCPCITLKNTPYLSVFTNLKTTSFFNIISFFQC